MMFLFFFIKLPFELYIDEWKSIKWNILSYTLRKIRSVSQRIEVLPKFDLSLVCWKMREKFSNRMLIRLTIMNKFSSHFCLFLLTFVLLIHLSLFFNSMLYALRFFFLHIIMIIHHSVKLNQNCLGKSNLYVK